MQCTIIYLYFSSLCLYLLFLSVTHSLAIHPNKELFATGQIGKDPFICVWNSKTMEMVSILQGGHDRGIATVAFSSDGEVSTTCIVAMCIFKWCLQDYLCIECTK